MKPDVGFFKDDLLVFVVISSVSLAAILFAYHIDAHVHEQKSAYEHRLSSLRNQLQISVDERKILQEKKDKFLELLASGRFTPADRMGWIDAVKHRSKSIGLPSLKYTLGSRQPYHDDALPQLEHFAVYRTPIELRIGMVHEGDLITLLDYLSQLGAGRFSVGKCEIDRVAEIGAFLPSEANLRASCSLAWFNFDARSEQELSGFRAVPG